MSNVQSKKQQVPATKKPALKSAAPQHPALRDRLSCRIDAKIKQRAEDAATILGQDLTSFTESALNEKAQAVIEREERLLLSERDFERFVEALNNPQPASARLKAAVAEYKAVRQQQPELNW